MLRLKNMMRATYLTKLESIPKVIDGGQIERACLLTDVINNKYRKRPCVSRILRLAAIPISKRTILKKKYLKTTRAQFEVSFKLYCYKQLRTDNRGFETPT